MCGTKSCMKGLKYSLCTANKIQCFNSTWHGIATFKKDSVIQMLEKFFFMKR